MSHYIGTPFLTIWSSDKIDLIILTKCMTTIQSCLIEWFYMLMNPPLVVCQKIDSNRLACQLNYYHFRLAWYCPTNQATTTTAASASGWRILCESCPPKRRTTSRTRASWRSRQWRSVRFRFEFYFFKTVPWNCSVTRWRDYFSFFGYLQQFKFAQKLKNPKLGSKFCQILNKPSIFEVCQSGEVLPNLVTLHESDNGQRTLTFF